MSITSVHIQHYKSLNDVKLDALSPVTLLVGPNAVGKSNVVDALRFLRDAVVDGLDHAISSRGGIEVIRQYSPSRPFHIRICVEFDQILKDNQCNRSYYDLKIASLSSGNYRVEREEAEWWAFGETDIFEDGPLVRQRMFRDADAHISDSTKTQPRSWRKDELALRSPPFFHPHNPVTDLLSGLRFSALYPNTLRNPSRPDTDKRLRESGENWASVLKSLRQSVKGREAFQGIMHLMRRVMPNLQDVKVTGVGGYLVPRFIVKDTPRGKEHSFDPVQLSDGTLRIFGILLGLYQLPPPTLFAIEEPEQTINPGVVALLADAFKEVSETTQLFITTHSPQMVDLFEPEQIRVVTLAAGHTVVSPIRASQIESVKEHLVTLQELMAYDNLQPQEAE